jgi:hypothetical protein
MCNQAVSLIAAEIERRGIPTVCVILLREIAERVRPPRALSVPFPLGYPFYESDCQGRFSSLLIAFRSSPWQSAPTDRNAAIVRTRGWAEQSYAADSSSVSPLIQ